MVTRGLTHPTARGRWARRLASRSGRRILVAALVAACAALTLQAALGIQTPLAFALIGLILAADCLLLYATSRVAELPAAAVDERQEAIRNRAYRRSYRVVMHALVWPAGVVVVLAALGDPLGWLHQVAGNTALVIALGTAGAQLVAFLPTMLLAWSEPDLAEAD